MVVRMWERFWPRRMRSLDWLILEGEPSGDPPVIRLAPGVAAATDTAVAAWLSGRMLPPVSARTLVGGVIPTGFEAYARVFHPASAGSQPYRWSAAAAWAGRVVHAEMQWEAITAHVRPSNEQEPWNDEPVLGCCPAQVREPLAELLRAHTRTPHHCWVCIWEGYGGVEDALAGVPRVHHPWRDYALLQAPLELIASGVLTDEWAQPNIWWPDDQAWCVATEIDCRSTYVAGTADCIHDLLADARLESLATQPDHVSSYDGDSINGPVSP